MSAGQEGLIWRILLCRRYHGLTIFSLPEPVCSGIVRLHKVIGHRYVAWMLCCFRRATKRSPLCGFRLVPAALRYKESAAMRLNLSANNFVINPPGESRLVANGNNRSILPLRPMGTYRMTKSKKPRSGNLFVAYRRHRKHKAA